MGGERKIKLALTESIIVLISKEIIALDLLIRASFSAFVVMVARKKRVNKFNGFLIKAWIFEPCVLVL